jgi:GTP 3',8-cyclase
MPREHFGPDHKYLHRAEVLSFEEISRLVGIFDTLGARKLRLTGGEPLLRKDLHKLIALLKANSSMELAMTSNGSLLKDHAERLVTAGLDRVTISLDSIDDATFRAMNDVDFSVQRVFEGIDAAQAAGLSPIKINAVIQRGVNDQGIIDLANFARQHGHIMRFIEFMDVGHTNSWKLDNVVPAAAIVAKIHALHPLEAVEPAYRGEVASRYRYADNGGEIGVISSVSAPFCGNCTRARLSAEGRLFTCLFASDGLDLRTPLRRGDNNEQITQLIESTWASREDRYSEIRAFRAKSTPPVEMSYIGG